MKSMLFKIAILLILWFLFGCEKCDQHQVGELYFTESELAINPYAGNEALVFRSLQGDSIEFANGLRSDSKFKMYERDYEEAKNYYGGCQGNFVLAEVNDYLISKKVFDPSNIIRISYSYNYTFDNPNYDKDIWFVFDLGSVITGFWGNYRIQDDSLYSNNHHIDSIVAFHRQLTIGPKIFHNVYELYCHNEDPRNNEWYSIAYYSKEVGFCGVRSNLGKLWYLESKN